MIIGLTSPGEYGIGLLPAAWDLSVPSPLPSLLADPTLDRVFLLVAHPWDPVTRARVTVYLSNAEYQTAPTDTPANQNFLSVLRSPYNCQFSLFSGSFDSASNPSYGDVQIIDNDGALDNLTSYSWAGCTITVYLGRPTDPLTLFSPIFNGTAAGLTWDTQFVNIQLSNLQELFNKPLQANLYTPSAMYLTGAAYASVTMPQPAGPMTYELWVRPDAVTSGQYDLVGVRNGTAAGLRRLDLSGGNLPRFSVRNDAGTLFSAQWGTAIPALSWHQITGVLDTSAGFIYLYVDRVLVASTAVSGTFNTTLSNFTVGRTSDTAGNYLSGRLGEIRVWSTARTATQIGTNLYTSLAGAETGLLAYYPAGEGTGVTSEDRSTNSYNLSFPSATWDTGDWQPANIVGKPKPLSYGQTRQRPAILVDSNAPGQVVFQVHDRSCQAIAVYDSGKLLTLGVDYNLDLARGLIYMLHSPVGAITADVQGDNDSAAGGYVSSAADIVRRIATRHGGLSDPAQINTTAFLAANAANSAVCGYVSDTQTTIDSALTDVLRSVSGKWVFDRLGLLFVCVFAAPSSTPTVMLGENDIAKDPSSGARIARVSTPGPSVRQRIGYHRIWQTQAPATLAATVSDADKAQFATDYSFAAPGSDLSILDGFPLAQTVETLTLLDTLADANAESIRRQTLFGQRQDVYTVEIVGGLFSYWLNDTVQLTYREERPDGLLGIRYTRWDLSHRLFVVIGIAEEVSIAAGTPDRITLTLWGPQPPGSLVIDTEAGTLLEVDTDGDTLLIG